MEDFTQQLLAFLLNRFVNHEVHQPLMTFIDDTRDILGVRTGSRIMARGSARIDALLSHEGTLKRVQAAHLNVWLTDPFLKVTFKYVGQTQGETWIEPGGIFVDHPWKNAQPAGIVTAILTLTPQRNSGLRLEVTPDAGHDDRPNNFIKDKVVPQTIGKLDALLEEFTNTIINT